MQRELADTKLLQDISAELIEPGDEDALYTKIVDAIAAIMRSDFATMQMLYPKRGDKGRTPPPGLPWTDSGGRESLGMGPLDTDSTCGQVLRTGKRAIASDVETCDFLGRNRRHGRLARCRHSRRAVDAAIFAKRQDAGHDFVALARSHTTPRTATCACSIFSRGKQPT